MIQTLAGLFFLQWTEAFTGAGLGYGCHSTSEKNFIANLDDCKYEMEMKAFLSRFFLKLYCAKFLVGHDQWGNRYFFYFNIL